MLFNFVKYFIGKFIMVVDVNIVLLLWPLLYFLFLLSIDLQFIVNFLLIPFAMKNYIINVRGKFFPGKFLYSFGKCIFPNSFMENSFSSFSVMWKILFICRIFLNLLLFNFGGNLAGFTMLNDRFFIVM